MDMYAENVLKSSSPEKQDLSQLQTTTFHKNIIKEIIRECYPARLQANAHFISFLTKLLLLDPNWGITDDIMSSRNNVQKFVTYVIALLKKTDNASLMTMQMQYNFTCNLSNLDIKIKENRKNLKKRLERLERSIVTFKGSKQNQLETLRKMIVSYQTLITGLGTPKDPNVYAEADMAFKSIANDDELAGFMKKTIEEKHIELDQSSKITCGIRLFNKDNGKGGSGIEDVPTLLARAIMAVRTTCESTLTDVMETVNIFTSLVDKCYVLNNLHDEPVIELQTPADMDERTIEDTKDFLILFRQYEVYIRRILNELNRLDMVAENLNQKFDRLIADIHKMVFMKMAVPAALVFPKFIELAKLWTSLQDQVIALSHFQAVMENLKKIGHAAVVGHKVLQDLLDEGSIWSDAERLKRTAQHSITSENEQVQVFNHSNFQNLDKVKIQYLGFCCWKLVDTKGALIPGNPTMGIARYQNRNYVFSEPEGSVVFSRNPENYIRGVLQLCRLKPQLIYFLEIEEKLKEFVRVPRLVEKVVVCTKVQDKGVQAFPSWEEVVPAKYDKNYRWNVWDLKREALILGTATQKRTTSCQTKKGFSMCNMRIQTLGHKEVAVQTMKDVYTNVARPMTFIYGLRGRKDDLQFVMDITRPLTK